MAEPWFNPMTFGAWFGAIVGGGGGTLMGIFGAVCGSYLVPRGKARGFVIGTLSTCTVLGLISLVVGIVAFFGGQPYAIWYPFAISGLTMVIVTGCLIPVMIQRYRAVEQQKIAADAIRHS